MASSLLPGLFFFYHFEELSDPSVGPAIMMEAGDGYFRGSYVAAGVAVTGYLLGALAWFRRRRRSSG